MRFFARRRLLRFDTRDIAKSNLEKKDFQHLATTQAPKEQDNMTTMNESRWNHKSSRKTSRAVQGQTEVIVRHARPVDEEYAGSRSQRKNIKAIFIQNADGERFKYPFIHPAGAFAMAQHVDHGGIPHDPAGKAIIKMSEQIAQLAEFKNKIHKATLHDDATGITERALGRLQELKARVDSLGKRHHYENWMAEFNEQEMMDDGLEMDDVAMEQYKQAFTQTSFQEELTGYFPLLHRIMSETNTVDLEDFVNETAEDDECDKCHSDPCKCDDGIKEDIFGKFEEWADATEQGTLTDDQIGELKKAIEELPSGKTGPELELGPDGAIAWQFFSEFGISDTDLEEKLKSMADVDPDTDALQVFKLWADENYPELSVALGMSGEIDTGDSEEQQSENEEMSMPKGAMSSEGIIKEVAKIVKSFYNKDNPEVGPFRGKENIAMDVKKQCAEKFGDETGDKAHQLAMKFMEKLSNEWDEKHGKPDDDGFARLKELIGNVKNKVEGIGDKSENGHAPGKNIMSAEEDESSEKGIGKDISDKSWLKKSEKPGLGQKIKDVVKGVGAFVKGDQEAEKKLDTYESSINDIKRLSGLEK